MFNKFYDAIGKKGHFCTVNYKNGIDSELGYIVETGEDKDHFHDLSAEEQKKALTWIHYNVISGNTVLHGYTSYGMKHLLESRTRIYMTNNQFKEAMLICDFIPDDPNSLNWNFYIKKSSPIFQYQVDGKLGLPMMGDPMDYSTKKSKEDMGDIKIAENADTTEAVDIFEDGSAE